jgi:hypothetical protein
VTALHAVPDLPDADLDALEQAVDNGLATAIDALAALRRRQAADKSDQIRARQTAYVLTDTGYVTKRWQQ